MFSSIMVFKNGKWTAGPYYQCSILLIREANIRSSLYIIYPELIHLKHIASINRYNDQLNADVILTWHIEKVTLTQTAMLTVTDLIWVNVPRSSLHGPRPHVKGPEAWTSGPLTYIMSIICLLYPCVISQINQLLLHSSAK